jgi:hypothetical protein
MKEVKVAVVKRSGVKFIFVDAGRSDPMTSSVDIDSETMDILAKKFHGLPILIRKTTTVGNLTSYSGDTKLIKFVRGMPLDAFRWKKLSSSRKWWQFWRS